MNAKYEDKEEKRRKDEKKKGYTEKEDEWPT